MIDAIATTGHNNPPSDQVLLQEFLSEKTVALRSRFQELSDALGRMPAVCEDEETAMKFTGMIQAVVACAKAFETLRVGEKEPYLTLGRTVDGFFKKYTDALDAGRKQAVKPLDAFLKKKEDEKRAAAIAEARRQREESERLAREAQELEAANMPAAANEAMQEAIRESDRAAKSDKLAEAKPADLVRLRGDYGGLATLRTSWVGEMISREQVDIVALAPHLTTEAIKKAIDAYVRAGGRALRGVRIYEKSETMVK